MIIKRRMCCQLTMGYAGTFAAKIRKNFSATKLKHCLSNIIYLFIDYKLIFILFKQYSLKLMPVQKLF
jgi:hypothetical protein